MKKRWRDANPEAVKAQKADSYQRNKETAQRYREENREKIRAAKKLAREASKEKIAVYQREYAAKNKERIAAQRKQWREDEVKNRWNEFYSKEEKAEMVKAKARERRAAAKELEPPAQPAP